MSDSDSDNDWEGRRMSLKLFPPEAAYGPTEEDFEMWNRIPIRDKREAGQLMRVHTYWLPILLQREEREATACWALDLGLISEGSDEISLKNLHRIEILEAILRALEIGTMNKDQTKHVVSISNMFNLRSSGSFEDAIHWLEQTGEPDIVHRIRDLGPKHNCFTVLHHTFIEFTHFFMQMATNLQRIMQTLKSGPSEYQLTKCEEMKLKGNVYFQHEQYEDAVMFYSSAIRYYPDNHIIYGNRALCYIRCKKYLKAVGDGKRATLINPLWAKGHYRYCEALFSLGEIRKAIHANSIARRLCRHDAEGIKDLEQQHLRFSETPAAKVGQPKKTQSKNLECNHKVYGAVHKVDPQNKNIGPKLHNNANKLPVRGNGRPATPVVSEVSEVKQEKQQVKNEGSTKNSKPLKSELPSKNGKGDSNSAAAKKKPKSRNPSEAEKQKADDKAGMCKELRSTVQDAHTALTDQRKHNAEQAFRKALVILEASTPKELGLNTVDVLLLLYGHASALTEIAQIEELAEAQRILEKIKSFEERTFQCLVYYAVGRVYLKENRFALALEQFSDSLQMVKNQITPGKLTWPFTKEVVKETQPDYFKEILNHAMELCKFPPMPEAVCRYEKCLVPLKAEIYVTDPDFKGYIRISCCQSCIVEYHSVCWKSLKTSSFFEKKEKDLLHESCLTPDCVGQICSIKIFCLAGLMKCQFEDAIIKPQSQRKPKVNQTCTSLKKLKSKDEHRLKRKQHKQSFKENQTINDEILQQKEASPTRSPQRAWLLYRDRVLLQINQNMELLREEKGLQVSVLTDGLKPWLELDSSRGNQAAEKILNWQQEQLETSQALELLLERKNRVWARVLIHLLSSCQDINPKLSKWACQLNDAGLNAAKSFIERYAEQLEQEDLAFLLNFGPLQDVIIEKLGTRPEFFSSMGMTVTDYLKQAPPHDTRLFIWTLEEHRDQYQSCHSILDDYFDMMDGNCSVLKKSDANQNDSPKKRRGRKKKPGLPMSSVSHLFARQEWEQDVFEDDSLSFLHPQDPFSVPSHLREEVAEFEDQYNSTRHQNHYKMILDNNPDPTKETLYDYFAQILDEHGPLVAEDPLLVGELSNFPAVAQLKIQEAGGFELFLLESLRFIKMGRCIGLAKHAVSLQQAGRLTGLDDLDDIADPSSDSPSPCVNASHTSAYTNYLEGYSLSPIEVSYHVLPNPYACIPQPPPLGWSASGVTLPGDSAHHWTNGLSPHQAQYLTPNSYEELDLDLDDGLLDSSSETTCVVKNPAAVQKCRETKRSVAVNTEIHERFESCQGDINKKQKSNEYLEQQIKEMANAGNKVNPRYEEDIAVFEEDAQKINANIQVTNKELSLFQQKLEEEVKKDQKEKKANQEGLKSLKLEIEELTEQHGSLTQSIREKKTDFDAKLRDFLELSNQSAAEKMSLEDEIKRCKASLTSATRRSHAAQVSMVESRQDLSLFGLYRDLEIGKAMLIKLDEAAHRFPTPDLEIRRNGWRQNVQEVEKKISAAETQYKEQLDQVRNGRRVGELLPVAVNDQHEAAASVAAKEFAPPPSSPRSTPPMVQPSAAEASASHSPRKPPSRTAEPPSVFKKAMERLAIMFPDYTRSDLMRFLQEFRSSSGGSLSCMVLQDLVSGVTQLILDHQEKLAAANPNTVGRGSPAQGAGPVWQAVENKRETHSNALNIEDPCIICHEDMNPVDICVLVCRHSFHDECIRSWLKEQSTCPTCRDHALLPDDFPALSSRRFQAQ